VLDVLSKVSVSATVSPCCTGLLVVGMYQQKIP
jgi:hypothetical protein